MEVRERGRHNGGGKGSGSSGHHTSLVWRNKLIVISFCLTNLHDVVYPEVESWQLEVLPVRWKLLQ